MSADNDSANPDPSVSAQSPRVCTVCGKETIGPYFEENGKVICLDCRLKMEKEKGARSPFWRWKVVATLSGAFFLLVGVGTLFLTILRPQPKPSVEAGSSAPAPSSGPISENSAPSLDTPLPEVVSTTAARAVSQERTPQSTKTMKETPIESSQGITDVSVQAAIYSPAPSLVQPPSGLPSPAGPAPLPSPQPILSNMNTMQPHAVPNSLANLTPIPNSLANITPLPNSLANITPLPNSLANITPLPNSLKKTTGH